MRRRSDPGVRRAAALLLAVALLGGCATRQNPDPLEPMNRKVFAFNETLDEYVLEPAAKGYRDALPEPVRSGVTNVFNNLRDAWSAVNLLLQGRLEESGQDWMRFSVNTVIGFGGVLDWGRRMGLEPHYEDLGQTLGVWGLEPGAYLVLPVLGASSGRDAVGLPFDLMASPETFATTALVANVARGVHLVNTRANLLGATDLLDDVALDKYIFVRDAYLQRRRSLVYDGAPPPEDSERYDLPEAPAPAASAPEPGASAPAPKP